MTAKPKKYTGGGYVADHQFRLPDPERHRLKSRGLNEDDLHWIENTATYYNIVVADRKARPTPAEVLAALAAGEAAVGALLDWLNEADGIARDHIRMAAYEHGMPWHSFTKIGAGLMTELRHLDDMIELARRRVGDPKRGRELEPGKRFLAKQIAERFPDRELAYDVLRSVLPDTKRNLQKLLSDWV